MTVAPFHVIIVPVNVNDKNIAKAAEELYRELKKPASRSSSTTGTNGPG